MNFSIEDKDNNSLKVLRFESTYYRDLWMRKKKSISVLNEPLFVLTLAKYKTNRLGIVRRGSVKVHNQTAEFSTDKVMIDFKDPVDEEFIYSIFGWNDEIISLSPLLQDEEGKDWTWIAQLKPEINPDVYAEKINKLKSIKFAEPDRIHCEFGCYSVDLT